MNAGPFPASWSRGEGALMPLDVAELDIAPPPWWGSGLSRAQALQAVHYQDAEGTTSGLRGHIAAWSRDRYGKVPADIYIVDSIRRAVAAVTAAVLTPGCRVVVAGAPIYRPLVDKALLAGVRVDLVPWRWTGGAWQIDPGELREALALPCRAIILNSPHNPTGASISPAALAAIVAAADGHQALVLVDEAYASLETNSPYVAAGLHLGRVVSFGSFTKALNMNGLRIAHVLDHGGRLRGLDFAKAFHTPSLLSEMVLAACLADERTAGWLAKLRLSLAEAADAAMGAFRSLPEIEIEGTPASGFFLWAKCRTGAGQSSAGLLRERYGIIARPAAKFFGADADRVRLTVPLSPDRLRAINSRLGSRRAADYA